VWRLIKSIAWVSCAILSGWLGSGCQEKSFSSERNGTNSTHAPLRRVKVAAVVSRPVDRAVTVLGAFDARARATIGAKVPGRLQVMAVDLGTAVKKGDVLARIDRRDYELKLRQAQAALAQARARIGLPLEGKDDRIDPESISSVKEARAVLDEALANQDRTAKLSHQGIVSPSQLDTAVAAYRVAENRYQTALEDAKQRQAMVLQRRAEMEIAAQELEDTAILAPFDGAIQERKANLGEYLNVGDPILTLVLMNPLRLRLEVPERDAAKIQLGQAVRATVTGDNRVHQAVLTRISPSLTTQNRMLVIEADVPNDGSLHPGTFARARIITDRAQGALILPGAAIRTFAGVEKVFVVEKGLAVEKEVTVGAKESDWVEITSGLKEGERVILDPGNLRGGERVEALE
jgi:membrane fusion protein, multidrug efflux system